MSIEKSKDLFWRRVGNIKLRILFSNIFACKLVWRKMNIFSSMCESTFWFLQTVFKRQRLKEISVYHLHTVGVRGHALLWSGLCLGFGQVYNKCTMLTRHTVWLKVTIDMIFGLGKWSKTCHYCEGRITMAAPGSMPLCVTTYTATYVW